HRARELREPGIGLDRDPAPALEIEAEGNVIIYRVAGADVEVEAGPALAEAAHEVKVFVALRVRDERHALVTLSHQISQPTPSMSVAQHFHAVVDDTVQDDIVADGQMPNSPSNVVAG